ncbi:MAG: anti-sigma regulatory factor [Planctomycetota bacterium]|nr:MAG: anti-sigma regulatory factor [Planctomycetota bacterium]
MPASTIERLQVACEEDLVRVRQRVRTMAAEIGLSLVNQTKIVTAASELARNMLKYGGGGETEFERVERNGLIGLQLTFRDSGPGIENIEMAMTDGYTTGGGMGLGLSGSKRLVNDFAIQSAPGQGTTVTVIRWK